MTSGRLGDNPREWWARLSVPRRVFSAAVAGLGTLMLFVGIWDRFGPKDTLVVPMSGDVNVAVAEFGALLDDGTIGATASSKALAASIYELLGSELEATPTFDFQVRSPAEVGGIRGRTPEERAAAADRLAERIDADVIVYGLLRYPEGGSALLPEFYLTDRSLLPNAEELIGHYRLGLELTQSVSIDDNVVARSELRQELLVRTEGLLQLIVGLAHFAKGDYQRAYDTFEEVQRHALFRQKNGEEIIHLFLGHAAGRLGDLDRADEQYQAALAVTPSYARALIGLGEVQFQRAHMGCEATAVDEAGVRRALDLYHQARTSPIQPPESNIDVRTALGVGRVHLCLSQAGVEDTWEEAQAEFLTVVQAYERGNEQIAELAAEAWSGTGLAQLSTAAGEASRLEQAAQSFERAIEIGTQADRESTWNGFLGFTYCELGRVDEGMEAYDKALAGTADDASRAEYEKARADCTAG